MLAAARALQGAFAALLAPAALSLLTTTFSDPGERGKAFGIFGAISIGGAVVGLLLGGVLTEYLSWRWCLYVNLALAVPTALVALLRVLTDEARSATARIDIRGALTVVPGLFALVYGLSKAETDGWGSATTLGFLAVGLALLVAFAAFERRVPHPLLPPRIVLDRNRGGSYLAVGIVGVGLMGGLFLLTFYLQQTLAYSPVTTGFAFLPLLAGIMASSISSSTLLLPRTGPRPLIVTGMLLAAAGMVVFAQLGVHSPYASHVLPGLILVGVGLGLVIAPAIDAATLGVEASDAGVASADRDHDAAGRRLDRHRRVERRVRHRGVELSRRRPVHARPRRAGHRARLHDSVLVGGSDLRRRFSRLRPRPRWPPGRALARSQPFGRLT